MSAFSVLKLFYVLQLEIAEEIKKYVVGFRKLDNVHAIRNQICSIQE